MSDQWRIFHCYNLIAPGVVSKIQPEEFKSALTFQSRWEEKKREAFTKYQSKMTFLQLYLLPGNGIAKATIQCL